MAIDKMKTGSWRARVLLPNGKRVSRCFDRKVDAEQWEAKIKSDRHNSPELMRRKTKFEQLCEIFLNGAKADLSQGTFVKHDGMVRKYHLPRFKGMWVEDISKIMVEQYKNDIMGMELSQNTKKFLFSSLKTILNRAVELDLLHRNPMNGIKGPRTGIHRTEYWEEKEAEQFLGAVKGTSRYPLYFLALNTGMRLGELLGLRWDCVDFDRKQITVRRTFDQKIGQVKDTTKTHKARHIGMNSELSAFMETLRQERSDDFVLDRSKLRCRDSSHAAREFAADCSSARVRVIHFHDLRHTYATVFVGKGGSIHDLAGVLGHSTTKMTERYAHFIPEHAARAAQVVSLGASTKGSPNDPNTSLKVVSLNAVRALRNKSGHKVVTNH